MCASSPKVGAFGSPYELYLYAKASPLWERWICEAKTERARALAV